VDASFDVHLLIPIRGRDKEGRDFEMTAMLAGRGKLVAFYERGGTVYRSEKQNRDFELASRVEFDTPVAGVLGNIHGLCAKVLLLGCVRVHSMVKHGETVAVRVGTFTSESPLTPIEARGAGSSSPPKPQTTVPNNFPIPEVSAIASAPQNVTRAVARTTFAPPALAPIAPRSARKCSDAADTIGTSAPAGETITMSKGMAAPTEKVTADVSAACTGRAVVTSEIPSSSRAWAYCAKTQPSRTQLAGNSVSPETSSRQIAATT
jgi:hypothetical protein